MAIRLSTAEAKKYLGKGVVRDRGMNRNEQAYAAHLDVLRNAGDIQAWWFEAVKLKLADATFLTPDFLVLMPDNTLELRDCKGFKQKKEDSMNRRSFLKKTTAALGASLVPSWLLPRLPPEDIDLQAFCWSRPWSNPRFELNTPFVQPGAVDDLIGRKPWQKKFGLPGAHMEPFRYATDARVCIRVPGKPGDMVDEHKAKLPNATALPWTHNWPCHGKWLPWPVQDHLGARETDCPQCYGTGDASGIPEECERCQGLGQYLVGDGWNTGTHPVQCWPCGGLGHIVKVKCPTCRGSGSGVFPALQPLGGKYIDCHIDAKIRRHLRDVEYFMPESGLAEPEIGVTGAAIKFRFAGGQGLLVPLATEVAVRRMQA